MGHRRSQRYSKILNFKVFFNRSRAFQGPQLTRGPGVPKTKMSMPAPVAHDLARSPVCKETGTAGLWHTMPTAHLSRLAIKGRSLVGPLPKDPRGTVPQASTPGTVCASKQLTDSEPLGLHARQNPKRRWQGRRVRNVPAPPTLLHLSCFPRKRIS